MKEPVDLAIDSGLGLITLSRGDHGNPITPDLLQALHDYLIQLTENSDVRAILLRSNTSRFCSGMDFSLLNERTQTVDTSEFRSMVELYSEILNSIYLSSKPVLCAVSGEVKAGGMGIVCACDVVVATPKSEFCLSEVLIGLIPANVLPYLMGYRLSPQKARYFALTSKTLDGNQAMSAGIVDEVADPGSMEKTLRGIVRRLLRSSPSALAELKRFTAHNTPKLEKRRSDAIDLLSRLIRNPEVSEALQAFNRGDTPTWFTKFKPEGSLFLEDC